MDNIQIVLDKIIKNSLSDLGFDKSLPADFSTEFSFTGGICDISNNAALKLSRILKKPPLEIAKQIVEQAKTYIGKENLENTISDIKAEGAGFLNFYLQEKYFFELLKKIVVKGGDWAKSEYGQNKKVLVEFVSANPTGPLSVAHARQAVVGDSLAAILNYIGFDAKKEYYLNDEGNQINILGGSVELRLKELNGEKIDFPENYYQGEYIRDMAREIKEKNIKVTDFPEYSGNYILEIIKKELNDFGVFFDCWYSQKSLRENGKIQSTLDYLREKEFIYDSEGAVWFKSTTFGDDKDRVVIKSDGAYTYLAPDIAYHNEKFKRGYQWLINLWGPDHHGYINRLKASVMALGGNAVSIDVVIVQLASIFRDNKPIEMSTRKGQYITLREVLDEVGVDASRFFFLMRRTSSHLNFDLEAAKKQTAENPVYYIQYAYARICSILKQSNVVLDVNKIDFSVLKEKEEIALMKKIWQFSSTLYICLQTVDSYMLTVYLQELAESFHKFYDRHRVLGQEENLTLARLVLLCATKTVLAKGLELVGVSRPEQM